MLASTAVNSGKFMGQTTVLEIAAPGCAAQEFDGEVVALNLSNGIYCSFRDLGAALWCDLAAGHSGVIFALLRSDGSLWLKGAGAFAARITAEGWERWTHARAGRRPTAMPYWRLPDAALDDPDHACDLAREALRDLT